MKERQEDEGMDCHMKAQSVGKSYDMVSFMSENLAVKKAKGILFLTDNDGDAVCGNGCVPYSSNTAQNNVIENICAINKSLGKMLLCIIHPEDGDGSIHQNVGTASTNDVAEDQRFKLPIPSNVHLQGLTNTGPLHHHGKNSTHQTSLRKTHTAYPHHCYFKMRALI